MCRSLDTLVNLAKAEGQISPSQSLVIRTLLAQGLVAYSSYLSAQSDYVTALSVPTDDSLAEDYTGLVDAYALPVDAYAALRMAHT